MFTRMGVVQWSSCLWLFIGAMAGAYLGSAVLIQLQGQVLEALVGVMVLATGINAMLSPAEPKNARAQLSPLVTT